MIRQYNISVQEFLAESSNGNVDYTDFVAHAMREMEGKNKKLLFIRGGADFNKRVSASKTLYGLPISVKDCICVKGVESCAGSKILQGYKPTFDATAISRIKEIGGRVLCKTNQDEFGFGTFCTNSAYDIPKNPFDNERACGGSSGGAGCITQALDVPHIALGQSTGGSISCPASFCGIVGLTPTYGLVSRYGLIDYANSLDKIGPMGKCVYDVAFMLSIIAGHDPRDQTTLNVPKKDYTKSLSGSLKGMKIGIPKEYFKNIDESVENCVRNAIGEIEKEGAKVINVSLPNTKYALASYYIIATAEASTNLAKYCGMRYGLHLQLKGGFDEYFSSVRSKGFGPEAKRRIMLGTFARMAGYRDAYYMKALKVRTMIINDFKHAFKNVDVLCAPTMPVLPPKFSDISKMTLAEQYQSDVLTVPANLAGLPMISVPCGFVGKLPVGLHIIGDHLQEEKILKTANAYEKIRK
ncbi:MAG: Asp-tRNA(Asn)/Glu-tRNA(Gln) amidotransferase subunit GatA [Candidatus Aenigmatarchaeota archaeon]